MNIAQKWHILVNNLKILTSLNTRIYLLNVSLITEEIKHCY